MSQREIAIYVFFYKPGLMPVENPVYHPVMAGNALSSNEHSMEGDDSGDSISAKNRYFSELTGIYWVWKNTVQDITGSCHYRRYFTSMPEPLDFKIKRLLYYPIRLYKKRYGIIYTTDIKRFSGKVIQEPEIEKIFETHDAILPQKRRLRYSIREHYRRYHNEEDLKIIEEILEEKYPAYLATFNSVMNGNRLYSNNMFILRKDVFDRFMGWWFDVLFEFEKRINLADYKNYQQRIFGFMGERLLTVWFFHQNLSTKELQVIYFKKLKKQ